MENCYIEKLKKLDFFEKRDILSYGNDISVCLYDELDYVPVISFIVPTYQRKEKLRKCLQSILYQNFDLEYEIVLIDNDTANIKTQNVLNIIKEFNTKKIRYYCNLKNIGGYGSCNLGIKLSRGKWICIVHDDDTLCSGWSRVMEKAIEDYGYIYHAIACGCKSIRKDKKSISEQSVKKIKIKKCKLSDMFWKYKAPMLGAVIKKDFLQNEIGGFITEVPIGCADYVFMAVIAWKGVLGLLNQKLYGYSEDVSNGSNSIDVWNRIIPASYYFRRGIAKKLYGRVSFLKRREICFLVAKEIVIHSSKRLNLSYFHGLCVNEDEIIEKCNINRTEYKIMKKIAILLLWIRYYEKLIKRE